MREHNISEKLNIMVLGGTDMKINYLCMSWQYLLQQLVFLIGKGYYNYCVGYIPLDKGHKMFDIDKKIMDKYNINISKDQRYRRKKKKLANFYYLRWQHWFFILRSDGAVDFDIDDKFYDIRVKQKEINRLKIVVSGGLEFNVALQCKDNGKKSVTVNLSNYTFKLFKAEIEDYIQHRQIKQLERFFERLRSLPAWQGVIKQEYKILEEVYKYAKKYNLNTKNKNLIKYPKEYPDLNLYPLRINTYRKIYDSKYINKIDL